MQSYKYSNQNALDLVLKQPSQSVSVWNMQSSCFYWGFTKEGAFLKTGSIAWKVKRLLKHLSLDNAKDVQVSLSESCSGEIWVVCITEKKETVEGWQMKSMKRREIGLDRSQRETQSQRAHKLGPRMCEEHVFHLLLCRQVQHLLALVSQAQDEVKSTGQRPFLHVSRIAAKCDLFWGQWHDGTWFDIFKNAFK